MVAKLKLAAALSGLTAVILLLRAVRRRRSLRVAEAPGDAALGIPTRLGDDTAIVEVAANVDRLKPKLGAFVQLSSDDPAAFGRAGSGDCQLIPDFLDLDTARQMFDALSRPPADGGEISFQQ
jgi:hypothetical protein